MNLLKRFQFWTDVQSFIKKYKMKQIVCDIIGKYYYVFTYWSESFGKNVYLLRVDYSSLAPDIKYWHFFLDEKPTDVETIESILKEYGNSEPKMVEKLL